MDIESAGNHTHRLSKQSLFFRIIPVTLYGPNGAIETFAFLDDGSSLTLIEEELANELGVNGRTAPLRLTWTGNVSRMEADSRRLDLEVSSANNGERMKLSDARTVKKLALPSQSLRIDSLGGKFKHLRGLPIAGYEDAVPRLLIGVNNLRLTIPLKAKEGRIHEPVAVKTRLGWCVYGGSGEPTLQTLSFHACESDEDLPELEISEEDRRAQQVLDHSDTNGWRGDPSKQDPADCSIHVKAAVPSAVVHSKRWRNQRNKIYGEAKITGYLTQEEQRQAEAMSVGMVQRQEYPATTVMPLSDHSLSRIERGGLDNKLYQLTPVGDEAGTLPVEGKIEAADEAYTETNGKDGKRNSWISGPVMEVVPEMMAGSDKPL